MITADLSTALVRRIADQLGFTLGDDEVVDPDASFFDAGGFRFGAFEFDSMDFVEMIVTLESELGVAILDAGDVDDIDTLTKLAGHVDGQADPGVVATFVERWS
jgi:acyl carrier protein